MLSKFGSIYRHYRNVFRIMPYKEMLRLIRKQLSYNIYPIKLPQYEIKENLDLLVLELPPRYQPMMPNGIGYLYGSLVKSNVKFQVLDLNIISYHQFNEKRLCGNKPITTEGGKILDKDLWGLTSMSQWKDLDVVNYFIGKFENIIDMITAQKPTAIGLSVHECNRMVVIEFIKKIRQSSPDIKIILGGYDCVHHYIGAYLFQDYDYMVIGEAEESISPLLDAIKAKDWRGDFNGILSKYDSMDRKFVPASLIEDKQKYTFPKYEWSDLSLYYSFDGSHMVPITASRGCKWGRCRFCTECFPFRARDAKSVVDEIEFFASRNFYKFTFNESDVNGDPQNLYDICSEIIKRGIRVQLGGQLRIDARNTREYFAHMARAGFTHLRFGVDGWSKNTLKLQQKGYNTKLILSNLRDCHSVGIHVAVNVVLGVPGETEEDIEETIENLLACKDWIKEVSNINTLILTAGSEYYLYPDKYNIRFYENKDDIYKKHPYALPDNCWYSEKPFVDSEGRMRRLERIHKVLSSKGMRVGDFARLDNFLRKVKGYYNPK